MTNYKELWRCGECCQVHSCEEAAGECCKPTVTEVYGCLDCHEVHNSAQEAEECCGVFEMRCPNCSRDYKSLDINAKAIEIAGHCTVCNPLYTIEQRFAIEDMHFLQTGNCGDLRLGASCT